MIVAYVKHLGKAQGTYVTTLYLFVKCLFVVNLIGQFFGLNYFLGTQYTFWGFNVVYDIFHGRPWQESGHFPRVTLCDFEVQTADACR